MLSNYIGSNPSTCLETDVFEKQQCSIQQQQSKFLTLATKCTSRRESSQQSHTKFSPLIAIPTLHTKENYKICPTDVISDGTRKRRLLEETIHTIVRKVGTRMTTAEKPRKTAAGKQ